MNDSNTQVQINESSDSEAKSCSINNETDNNNLSEIVNKTGKIFSKSAQAYARREKKIYYTPISTFIDKDAIELAPAKYDLTKKIIIIYGLAALLNKIHEKGTTKVNFTPNYVFLDDKYQPFIDIDKLNSDSKNQNVEDFVLFNTKFKSYLPPELIEEGKIIFEEPESKMKADVYIFGSICLSIISKSVFDESTDLYEIISYCNDNLVSGKLLDLINSCLSEPCKRPSFDNILFIITSQPFINNLERFDVDRFIQYQKTVVDEKYIVEINSNFDITSIPNIKLYLRTDFKLMKGSLGTGASGVVRKARNIQTKEIVAFKEVNEQKNEEDKMRIFREIEILACTDHYAIQKLYGYIKGDESKNQKIVILTLLEKNGSLKNILKDKHSELDYTQKFIIMYGIASGMYYLHERNIFHRDLKPENVLLNDDMEPLITDFGLSKITKKENEFFVNTIPSKGTPIYMAPELFDAPIECFFALYNSKLADVFSFAMLVYYLFSGNPPWINTNINKIRNNVIEGKRPTFPSEFPKLIRLLVEACWAQEPTQRPSFEEILRIIGHSVFMNNLGFKIDKKKFNDYQRKVLIESFNTDDLIGSQTGSNGSSKSNRTNIFIKGIKFPKIPEGKIYSNSDFKNSSPEEKIENPFYDITKVEKADQSDDYFYQAEIKEEFVDDIEIISRLSDQIQVLLNTNHPSINNLYGIFDLPPKISYKENAESLFDIFPVVDDWLPALITPYASNENLLTRRCSLSITQKFIILYGIAAGMYYLHKKGMTHLNLKPENILLNDKLEPLINIDITSRPKPSKKNLIYILPAFSFPYVAPELLNFQNSQGNDINEKFADVYSFSMIAYFLISGLHPWDLSLGFQSILRKTLKGERPMNTGLIPQPFDKLIEDCWSTDPLKRLSFKEILNHIGSSDFIRSISLLNVDEFKRYQKKVVTSEFIFPIQICLIRKRSEFEIIKIIGSGTFGNVTLVTDKTNNNQVVYKVIPKIGEKEKEVLSSINFPSIAPLYGFIEPDEEKKESAILFPYAVNSDLDTMIKKEIQNKAPPEWDYTQKCITIYGIARGMHMLHSHGISHQDLKPTNILLNDEFEPWITDFGIAKFVDPNQSMYQTMTIGPSYYMSPEAFIQGKNPNSSSTKYDEQLSDVYSFGMLIFYLMTGMQPWSTTGNQIEMMNKIVRDERPTIPDIIPQSMKDLIQSCWNPEPSERPNFQEIVNIMSDPKFYQSDHSRFKSKIFYEYQIKLGDPQFIKFSSQEIKQFQSGRSTSILDFFPTTNFLSAESILRQMASKGDAQSQYRLGLMLKEGKTLKQDLESAVEYLKQSSNQGYLDGIIAYAICLKEGTGVETNKKEAYNLIQTAINKGSIDALIILASWYSNDFPRKYGIALDLLNRARENDHPDAPALIGSLFEKRKLNTVTSKEEIMQYYKESCFNGSYEGMYHMATFYHYGIGIDKNQSEAARLYNLVAKNTNHYRNQNQNPAIFSLTILYEELGETEFAFKLADYYRDKDMFVGYLRCADLYERGVGVPKNEEKANEYLTIAKEKRFTKEQLKVALLYSRGKGVIKNKEKGFFWTKIAAENGSSHAQANLAHYYLRNGPNYELAEHYGIMSYKAGNQRGMWQLSRVYRCKEDDEQEIFYLEQSVKAGYERGLVDLGIKYKEKNRKKEAIKALKEAADKKLPKGMFHYGNELFNGKLVKKNIEEGLKMIESAAKIGCREAIQRVIDIYSSGEEGVNINMDIANEYKEILKRIPKHFKH